MTKRKFYIIGHNPNTVDEAIAFLDAGCNALEPDIEYERGSEDTYYVSEEWPIHGSHPHDKQHSLQTYLTRLSSYLAMPQNSGKLCLIAFDVKDPYFDVNDFCEFVQEYFSRQPGCEDVAILVTIADVDHAPFLNAGMLPSNWGVGIDGEDSPDDVEVGLGRRHSGKMCYAYGTSLVMIDPDTDFYDLYVYQSLSDAKGLQILGNGQSFAMVYGWTVRKVSDMKRFLALHIDGMIVDLDSAHNGPKQLMDLVTKKPYSDLYDIARYGDNPFAPSPMPAYVLAIHTRDEVWAGTDAMLKFTLKGSNGKLFSTIDCNFNGMMESGQVNSVTFEGLDLGDIQTLTIESDGGHSSPDWKPESMILSSALMASDVFFEFAADETVSAGSSVTKTPSGDP